MGKKVKILSKQEFIDRLKSKNISESEISKKVSQVYGSSLGNAIQQLKLKKNK